MGGEGAPGPEEQVAALEQRALVSRGEDAREHAQVGRALGQPQQRSAVEDHRTGAREQGARHEERGEPPLDGPEVEAPVERRVEGDQRPQRRLDPGQAAGDVARARLDAPEQADGQLREAVRCALERLAGRGTHAPRGRRERGEQRREDGQQQHAEGEHDEGRDRREQPREYRQGREPEQRPERRQRQLPARRQRILDPVALVGAEGVPLAVDVVLADAHLAAVAEARELPARDPRQLLDQLVLHPLAAEQREGIAALGARELEQAVLEVLGVAS